MAHFAELDDSNNVIRVVVVANAELLVDGVEVEQKGIDFLKSHFGGGRWVQTSYNKSFRKNYAAATCVYDEQRDAFIYPSPFPSWVLNEDTCNWEPPIPHPGKEFLVVWDELTQSWVEPTLPITPTGTSNG